MEPVLPVPRDQEALIWCACWIEDPASGASRLRRRYQVLQIGCARPPILKRLRRLLDRILPSLPPRGEFAKAIGYTLNHRPMRFQRHNNRGERALPVKELRARPGDSPS